MQICHIMHVFLGLFFMRKSFLICLFIYSFYSFSKFKIVRLPSIILIYYSLHKNEIHIICGIWSDLSLKNWPQIHKYFNNSIYVVYYCICIVMLYMIKKISLLLFPDIIQNRYEFLFRFLTFTI